MAREQNVLFLLLPVPRQPPAPSTLPFISSPVIRNVALYSAEHREYFRLTRNLCQRGWAHFRSADLLMCLPRINYWRASIPPPSPFQRFRGRLVTERRPPTGAGSGWREGRGERQHGDPGGGPGARREPRLQLSALGAIALPRCLFMRSLVSAGGSDEGRHGTGGSFGFVWKKTSEKWRQTIGNVL